jgi:hypothetical protein
MKKILSVMLGLSLVLGSASLVVAEEGHEKHDKKEEHKDPKPADHKPEEHKK